MLHQQTIHDILTKPPVPQSPIPKYLERRYDQLLCSLYVSPTLKGYHYLKRAFYHEYRNRSGLLSLNKDIYEEIATFHSVQTPAVERCISFAIQQAYCKNPKGFLQLFPDCEKAPSNFRFMKTLSILLNYSEEETT